VAIASSLLTVLTGDTAYKRVCIAHCTQCHAKGEYIVHSVVQYIIHSVIP
jgi:hypothetical protein